MDEKLNKEFNKEIAISLFRMIFYLIVVYGSLLVGVSNIKKVGLIESDLLWFTLLFLPFIYVYSLLFEITDKKFFPSGKYNFRDYFLGDYKLIGWTILFFLFPLIYALVHLISISFIPFELYPIPILLPLALAGYLFSSRYQYLQKNRFGELSPKPAWWKVSKYSILRRKSVKGALLVYSIAIILLLLYHMFISSEDSVKNVVVVLFIIFGLCLFFVLGDIFSRNKIIPRPFFGSTIAREPAIIISTLWLPFLAGIYISYYEVGSLNSLSHVFFSSRVITFFVAMFAIGQVLELMRYLGKYDQSFSFKSNPIVERTEENEEGIRQNIEEITNEFGKSVRNYILIFIFVLSLFPLIYLFAEFSVEINFLITPMIIILIAGVLLVIKPFDRMGFIKSNNNSDDNLKSKIKNLLLRRRLLIGVKIVGYILFLLIFFIANQKLQVYPTFISIEHESDIKIESGKSELVMDRDLFDRFIEARESDNYLYKKKFLMYLESLDESRFLQIRNTNDLLTSLRFSSFDRSLIKKDSLLFKECKLLSDFNSINTDIKKINERDISQDRDLIVFVLGAFITILIGLILSSFVTRDESNFNSLSILVGVISQSIIVGFIAWYFFKPINFDTIPPYYSSFFDNLLYALKYQGNTLFVGITYMIVSLSMLIVVSFDKYFQPFEKPNINSNGIEGSA